MTEREVLKLALDALGEIAWSNSTDWQRDRAKVAITAIKEALAQPEHSPNCALLKIPSKDCDCQDQQKPVAITITGKLGNIYSFTGDYSLKKGDKVYTTPPQRKPWVGLTEQEHTDIAVECGCMSSDWVFYGATVERLLKEKNS